MKDFLIWLYYNKPRIQLMNADQICSEYENAIAGDHKVCKCENKSKAVNNYWEDWQCTYCLRPKK